MFPLANPQDVPIVDCVPKSQLFVFYGFVTHIHNILQARKLRFHDQMNLTVESSIRLLAFNNYYPIIEYSNSQIV